jgi:hypothetical protein
LREGFGKSLDIIHALKLVLGYGLEVVVLRMSPVLLKQVLTGQGVGKLWVLDLNLETMVISKQQKGKIKM